jgi:hypothetical protein
MFRCSGQNVQLLPENARNCKSRRLIDHVKEGECDAFMMEEVGLSWGELDPSDQWDKRVMGLTDGTTMLAHNATEPELSNKLQCGGVGMVAAAEAGKDPSGMGRWVWMQMEGKEGHHVRFMTACRPCQSGDAGCAFQQREKQGLSQPAHSHHERPSCRHK